MKFLFSTLLLAFSLLLFSCKKEEVRPIKPSVQSTLTTQQQKELNGLIKANPGVPIDVLIGLMGLCNSGSTTGITSAND